MQFEKDQFFSTSLRGALYHKKTLLYTFNRGKYPSHSVKRERDEHNSQFCEGKIAYYIQGHFFLARR